MTPPVCGSHQPGSAPVPSGFVRSVNPTSSRPTLSVSRPIPAKSIRLVRLSLRPTAAGSTRAMTARAASPIGRLTRKVERQPT